jgi:hypothetical protein
MKRASQELNLDDNAHVSVIAYVRAFMRWVSSLERRCKEMEASIINKSSTSSSSTSSYAPQKTAASFDKASSQSVSSSTVHLETSSGRQSPTKELSRSISMTSLNESASSVLRGGGASVSSEGETSCEQSSIDIMDEHYLRTLLQEVSNFFHQIRSSNIISKLVRLLKTTNNLDEQKAIEQFVWYAWSKHSSVQIQDHPNNVGIYKEEYMKLLEDLKTY